MSRSMSSFRTAVRSSAPGSSRRRSSPEGRRVPDLDVRESRALEQELEGLGMDGLFVGQVEEIDLDQGEDRGRVDGLEDDRPARGELGEGRLDELSEVGGRQVLDDLRGKDAVRGSRRAPRPAARGCRPDGSRGLCRGRCRSSAPLRSTPSPSMPCSRRRSRNSPRPQPRSRTLPPSGKSAAYPDCCLRMSSSEPRNRFSKPA